MVLITSLLLAMSVTLFTMFVLELADTRSRALMRRLNELAAINPKNKAGGSAKARNFLSLLLLRLGQVVLGSDEQRAGLKERLAQAGYRSANAVSIYWGVRIVLSVALGILGFFAGSILGGTGAMLFATSWLMLMGWLLPSIFVGQRQRAREQEIQSALPDTLDLLVVCVEAGLGLNQAWVRVSEEIRSLSPAMADELSLVNFQIRAGVPREEALRALGTRSQSQDLRSLAAILIQTDRFGTSVSTALRVQAESLRTRRRQRAEEAAAKTAVKLSFPLVLCIMPSLFTIVLGGAIIEMVKGFAGF